MPQNTPMKRQFITIDGRTVMSNLPQHWGGDDWKITGVDNPLPVGNYVQTEAGVWIPQKGSDDGAADVRLTRRKVLITAGEYVQTLNVSAGVTTTVTITPPVGEMWKIKNLFFDINPPVGATRGTHYVEITYGSSYSGGRRVVSLVSNHNKKVRLQDNVAHDDVSSKFPRNDVSIQSNILSLVVTNSMPLSLSYTNNTDATQNGTFFIYIVREVEYIA